MKKVALLLCCFMASVMLYAQEHMVSGMITGPDGLPVPGVNVLEKGTTNGTISNMDGVYQIKVRPDGILVFSSIGLSTAEVAVKNQSQIDVTLQDEIQNVKEVVITALGIKRKKKALGYSIQGVQGEDIAENKDPNLLNSLNGKVAGVQITQGNSGVGSSSKMVIRGENSLANDNQPLFVVDGVPVNNYTTPSVTTSASTGAQEVDYGNGAADINPDDIESISVLKGANAAALYGSRAANGVVLITTKTGKVGKKGIGVSVNSSTTFESFLVMPPFQNEFGQGSKGEYSFQDGLGSGTQDDVDESWGPAFADFDKLPQFDSPSVDINGNPVRAGDYPLRIMGYTTDGKPQYTPITPTDWKAHPDNVEDFFDTGKTFTNNIALYGSNDKGDFRLSYTNLTSEGIIPNVNLDRNNVSVNAGYKLTNKISVKASMSYIHSKSDNRPAMGYGPENPMYLFAWYGRSLNTASFEDYWIPGYEGVQQYTYNIWHENPYFNMYENTNAFDKNRMLGNVVLNYQITNNLSLMLRSGVDWFFDNRVSKRAYSTKRFPKGMFREDDVFFKERNSDFLLTYTKALNENWGISVSAGGNRMDQMSTFTSVTANELAQPGEYYLANSAVPLVSSQYDTKKRINSLYGLAQISFNEYLFVDITARNDWSSTLPDGNNSYFYPSVSLSGVVSDMMQMPSWISFAKLRLGYAEVGNDTDPYRLRSIYKFTDQYASRYGLTDSEIIANADLKPERQRSYEAGVDLALFNGRIGLDLTYYQNNNKNQIIQLPIASSSGYSYRVVNAGEIRNSGIEAMLNIQPVKTNNFNWDVTFNFAKNKGEVLSIADDLDEYIYNWSSPYDNDDAKVYAIARKGQTLGDIYGTGFKQVEVNGKMRTVYENGLPVADPNIKKLGNYNPDFMLGISNSFAYKRLKLHVLFDWRQGGEIVSRFYSIASRTGVLDHTLLGRTNGADGVIGDGVRWDADQQGYVENDVKVTSQTYHKGTYRRIHEESALFDASFVKLRELSLSYSFNDKLWGDLPLHDVKLSLVGRNLAIWTEQDYFDPETGSYENESYMPGVEEMSYPSTKSIGFNLSLKF
ncbi:MAG: SusC/RagA family TonB-linked outer membrane protein [Carboxylicivirga sp.]|jgi:TonB-linked SusC/RagA family outer membrane protein|nr:SusC/RagA family TonB-linked outer membrane protein [Carboxylicivirga sp.]